MTAFEQAAQAIAKEAGAVWPQDAERYRRYAKAALGVQGWQSIETAPIDGTVVLTNEGTCMFYDGRWYLCSWSGIIPSCADWGFETSEETPTHWMHLPDLPKPTKSERNE